MRERPDDKRVTKTIRTIHAAFEEMLCEMPYQQITVKELCERALMNKKTFYRYYETMDFLLAEFQENMMVDYLTRVEGMHIPQDLEAITREFFAFAVERGEVFERITCDAPYKTLHLQMTDRVLARYDGKSEEAAHTQGGILAQAGKGSKNRITGKSSNKNADTDPTRSILLAYVTESTLAIYRQWVADGKTLTPNEITNFAVKLVCKGALT